MTSTKSYSGTRKGVVRFVRDQLTLLEPDYALITIIKRDISGEPYAISAIGASLVDIERLAEKHSLGLPQTTSQDPTPAGLSL